ncbi:MAG: CusA/CzcA family heavy metal efflux RND transporter, partial [Candidatus Ratteibacteria bacterium]
MDGWIEKIIDYSARNKFIVLILVAAAAIAGALALKNLPLDAVPDLSDTQVIIFSRWDRPPQVIEDQVTYPITTALLGAPKVKDIRGFSDYGFSYVYVVFEDGTDIYWARSRVTEYLSKVTSQLPPGVQTEIGPDATGLGWVFEYALVDDTGKNSLEDLTTFQNWRLKYALQSVKGVSEVASVGGFTKQYQVTIDPNALLAYNLPLNDVVMALQKSNQEAGARLLEISGREYMVTIRGYLKSLKDIEDIVLKTDQNGVPVRISNVATVQFGPDIRRGVAELNGRGEVVGGIVIIRYQENALEVINRVKEQLKTIQLPEGVKLVITYDRSEIIHRAINTLKSKLREEMIVVSLIILLFLLHFPSAIIPIITLPIAVLIAFIPMYYMKLTANIMSLGGIAIAIGAMVDAAIVVVENSHKKLSHWEEGGRQGDYREVLISAIKEVGQASFFSLLVIAVAFMPIFTLEGIEGRLFKPLAFTKNFALFFAAVLAITLDPAIRLLFTKLDFYEFKPKWLCGIVNHLLVGRIHSEEKHPVSRALFKWYEPVVHFVLRKPRLVIFSTVLLFLVSMPFFFKLGTEFMPPLNEGSILYMPTTPPGISVTEATKLLGVQDKILKSFPEVTSVFGKAGRAATSTDPAPYSMMETTVLLKPQNQWRSKPRWYSNRVPEFLQPSLRLLWPDKISWDEMIQEMDQKLQIPGQVNAWTMPIKARIDMLTTGIRTPVGIKIQGDDLKRVEEIGLQIEALLKGVPGTRSIYAERTGGGYFVDFTLKREEIARYGLTVEDVQTTLMSAIGGENIS